MPTVYIGLGSNLGDREAYIQSALDWIQTHNEMMLEAVTTLLETPPWGMTDQPLFLNAVARIHTELTPHALLTCLKNAEVTFGRDLGAKRWGPRVIDLDILLYGELVLDDPHLTIPHPRITERDFVLKQLLELKSDLVHPRYRRPLSIYLN